MLRDVTYRFAPFGIEAAREMTDEIKGVVVMKGYRGREALDTEGLAQVLSRVSVVAARPPRPHRRDGHQPLVHDAEVHYRRGLLNHIKAVNVIPR